MTIELIKEYIVVDQEISRFTTQTIIEEDLIIPDYKPDIERILSIRGRTHVNNKVMEGNKYFIEGMAEFQILYQSIEGGIKLQQSNIEIPFSHWVELGEEEENLEAMIKSRVKYTDYELINTRKLSIRGVVAIEGKFIKNHQCPLLKNIKGLDQVHMLPKWLKITNIEEQVNEQTMVKEEIILEEMPPVVEIIKTQARVLESDIKLSEGRLMINASVDTQILYIGEEEEDQGIKYVEYKFPFTHYIEISSITEEMKHQLNFSVVEILTQVKTNEEGIFDTIDMEVIVDIKGNLYKDYDIETVVDAYSPDAEINLEKEEINCQEMVLNQKVKNTIKEKISTLNSQEGIGKVLLIEGSPIITQTERLEDKWIVEGVVEVEMLYQLSGEEENYQSISREIPFYQNFQLENQEEVFGDISVDIEHLTYQLLNANELELNIILDIDCQLFRPKLLAIINNIEEMPETLEEDTDQARISMYFKQPHDSLWEIGKRYGVTIEELLKQNDIEDQDNIPNYKPIIILK